MAGKNKKVVRYRKPVRINIGIIIFLFIFVYIAAQIILYLNKDHISIYEVVSTSMADNNTVTGLILRKEEIYVAEQSGYVNFYVNNGGRVSKQDVLYSIDETGNIYTQLMEVADKEENGREETAVQGLLMNYRKNNAKIFSGAYALKDAILTETLQDSGTSMLSGLEKVLQVYGDGNNFHVRQTEGSGVIAYYSDGYESCSREDITYEDFDRTKYQKKIVQNTSLVEAGSAVCKVIPSESWSIIVPVDQEQYNKLSGRNYVDITIEQDGIKTTAAVSVFQVGNDLLAELSLQRYLVRYLDQRYLDVSISLNSVTGLKIPKSAIVEKAFFKVPLVYFTSGGNSSSDGLVRETYTENGEIEYTYIATDIYYKDDEYAYISSEEELKAGDRIRKMDSSDSYILSETATLRGVYNANKGYAIFRRIEPLYENEEYSIIESNTAYGLSEYDHIILQGDLAVNQAIIY